MFLDISIPDYYWQNKYKGTFTLIDEYRNMYEKPEEIKLRTKVMILENAKEIEEGFEQETYIGKIGKIQLIQDDYRGLWYGIAFDEGDYWIGFPHYCVRPVEKVEEKEEIQGIPGFDGMIEEFEELCIKAQNIVNKYKK